MNFFIAYHIVVGNQIIVKSESTKISELVLDALQVLLPSGCCRICYNSNEYIEPWRYNFLGLPDTVSIPDSVDGMDQLVVISAKLHNNNSNSNSHRNMNEQQPKLDHCSFRLHYLGQTPDEFPTILDRLMLILIDNNIGVRGVDKCLNVLKEEWLNKSKLLFQLTKQSGDDLNRRMEIFVKLTKCNKPIDEMVVKFWQAGLSKQYKSFVLNKISNSNSNKTVTTQRVGL